MLAWQLGGRATEGVEGREGVGWDGPHAAGQRVQEPIFLAEGRGLAQSRGNSGQDGW